MGYIFDAMQKAGDEPENPVAPGLPATPGVPGAAGALGALSSSAQKAGFNRGKSLLPFLKRPFPTTGRGRHVPRGAWWCRQTGGIIPHGDPTGLAGVVPP